MRCGVGGTRGSDLALLWLWRRLAATAPIRPLAWEPPYAEGSTQEMAKRQQQQQQRQRVLAESDGRREKKSLAMALGPHPRPSKKRTGMVFTISYLLMENSIGTFFSNIIWGCSLGGRKEPAV